MTFMDDLTKFQELLTESTPDMQRIITDTHLFLLKGICLSLFEEGSEQSIAVLVQAAHAAPRPEIRQTCVRLLAELAGKHQPDAVEGLIDLVVFYDQRDVISFLKTLEIKSSRRSVQAIFSLVSGKFSEYHKMDPHLEMLTEFYFVQASESLQSRLEDAAGKAHLREWLLLVSALRSSQSQPFSELITVFPQFSIEQQKLALTWLDHFARANSPGCKEAICQLFIQHESIAALDLARQQAYTPGSPVQQALFHFLAGNWHDYAQIDINHSLISQAYAISPKPVRKRILELSRSSGHQDWIGELSASAKVLWLEDLSDADWELTLSTLRAAQRLPEIWRLAQLAPPFWSARLLTTLDDADWQPAGCSPEGWKNLLELSRACLASRIEIKPANIWRSPSPDILCLAYSTQHNLIAAGGSDSAIYLWDLEKAVKLAARIGAPAQQTRCLAFNPGSEYLVAATGDHILRTFHVKDGKLVKNMEGHAGLVRSLVFRPDGRELASASFDGSLRFWRFPQGQLLNSNNFGKSEIFGLAVNPDGRLLLHAGADQLVHVRQWGEGRLVHSLSGHQDVIVSLACDPGGALTASASRDRQIKVWNYHSGKEVASFTTGDEATSQMAFHPAYPVLICGTLQGSLALRSTTTGRVIAQVTGHSNAITGMASDLLGERLFTSSMDGLICQWDLSVFLAVNQPQRKTSPEVIRQLIHSGSTQATEQNWLKLIHSLNQFHRQFDIHLEDAPQRMVIGDFDIQL